MYDVIFGGKRMTKRLTIALIALVALVLVAVLPVSATYYDINNTIYVPGATVYIGEQQLNFGPALAYVTVANYGSSLSYQGGITTADSVGWWASAATILTTSPTTTQPLSSGTSFYVSPAASVSTRATGI